MVAISYSRKNPDYPVVYSSFGAMHTRVELLAVGLCEEQGRALMTEAEQEVKRLERLFKPACGGKCDGCGAECQG